MPIFIIFYPHVLPQLSEKREGRKIYEKCKTACRTTEGDKINEFGSWGKARYPIL